MCNVTVIYSKRNEKVQRNKGQSRSEQTDQRILDQENQIMIGAFRVEHIIDGAIRSDQIELRGIFRL